MGITPLPEATTLLLGSAQCITSTLSLIKELLDNSLDARATSIEIIVSQNTLDTIEVRDNGHGIAFDDLESLAKNGHTSKLRCFEDLKDIGGTTLGFRGQALASAVQLGEVSVTTRSDGEPVAILAKLKASGGTESRTRKSHPIGTTISVTNLMVKLPVRRKVLLQEAPKTLARVKELLQSYALARPSVRFSLKIAKSKKASWSFAPRRNDGIKEAISQVVGRDTAMQCFEKAWKFSGCLSNTSDGSPIVDILSSTSENYFLWEAFIPKPNADLSKLGSGQFLSIDSRPMSHERGTMKKICSVFKKYLQNIVPESFPGKPSHFFFRLNLKCPIGSYDPNIEPAKDEVLFANESAILESVEALFKEVYGSYNLMVSSTPNKPRDEVNSFNILLSNKTSKALPVENLAAGLRTPDPVPNPSSSTRDVIERSPDSESSESDDQTPRVFEASQGNRNKKRKFNMAEDFTEEAQKTPIQPRSLRASLLSRGDMNQQHSDSPSSHTPRTSNTSQDEDHLTGSSSMGSSERPAVEHNFGNNTTVTSGLVRQAYQTNLGGFITAKNLMETPLPSPPWTAVRAGFRRPNGRSQMTSSLLGHDESPNARDGLIQTRLTTEHHPSPNSNREDDLPFDLAWAMDFERRKEEATRERREKDRSAQMNQGRQSNTNSERTSPHKNRYNAAIIAIEASQSVPSHANEQENALPKTSLPDGDPRSRLMREDKSVSSSNDVRKPQRTRTNLLPLEAIPNNAQMHGLLYSKTTSLEGLRDAATNLFGEDSPRRLRRFEDQKYSSRYDSSAITEISKSTKLVVDQWLASTRGQHWELESFLFANLSSTDTTTT